MNRSLYIDSPSAAPAAAEVAEYESTPEKRVARKRCKWGYVESLVHAVTLDGSKCPSDGLAPIGLGELQAVSLRRITSFDEERDASRRCVRAIPSWERRAQVMNICRSESLDFVERDCDRIKRQRYETAIALEHGDESQGEDEVDAEGQPASPEVLVGESSYHQRVAFEPQPALFDDVAMGSSEVSLCDLWG